MNYLSIQNTCVKCDLCRIICPEKAIKIDEGMFFIDTWLCTECGICLEICPVNCIKYEKPPEELIKRKR